MYSQSHEESVIVSYFQNRVGKFLDVGAHNGVIFSNTRRLVELGWQGVLVEPDARAFGPLIDNCRGHAGLVLVNAALETTRRICPFWESGGDCVSSTLPAHRDVWAAGGVHFEETWIQTLAVSDFLSAFPGPYQFISLDTEGTTGELLCALPLDSLGVELISVEYSNENKADLEAYCRRYGLTQSQVVGCNLLVSR